MTLSSTPQEMHKLEETLHDDLIKVIERHGMNQSVSSKRMAEYLLRCIEALDVAVMGGK